MDISPRELLEGFKRDLHTGCRANLKDQATLNPKNPKNPKKPLKPETLNPSTLNPKTLNLSQEVKITSMALGRVQRNGCS